MDLSNADVVVTLSSSLWGPRATSVAQRQLQEQGRTSPTSYRYNVTVEIIEGQQRPAKDVDNYAKQAIDAITRTQCLWRDDEQIDTIAINRRRDKSRTESQVIMRIRKTDGQHSGVPSFFKACCAEAKAGRSFTYAHPGYHLTMHLRSQQPYDVPDDAWGERIEALCGLIDGADAEGIWNWFYEHFPKCMKLVPKRRLDQFVAGVSKAYEDGRLDD